MYVKYLHKHRNRKECGFEWKKQKYVYKTCTIFYSLMSDVRFYLKPIQNYSIVVIDLFNLL